ncbi:MAG: hypothetical protein DHS20C17_32900 [Cyclobacteriaceae bacterium]|nr:MAG: hypothetical protein DHS20C17_32900 [Cyclobacteriaceae bacterium]
MKSITVVLIAVFFAGSLCAQYPVSSCEEMGLRPIDPVDEIDILGRFYQAEDSDQRGCWVHYHPNGTDFVVTPKTWKSEPNTTRMKIIHEAMEAISEARETYQRFGTFNTNLYYIFDDSLHSASKAFWIADKGCWMRSGIPPISRITPGNRQQIYAHEIGHCLIMENLNNYEDSFELNDWFDESVAEYLGSEVYPANNREHGHSRRFGFSASFRQRYDAYHLWKYYIDREGDNMLFPMMQSLANISSLNARRDYLRRTEFDKILHDFYFDSYRERLIDSDGVSRIPVTTSTLKAPTINLNPDLHTLNIEEPLPADQLNGFNLVIPEGYDLDIDPLAGVGDPFYQSLLEGDSYHIRNWNSKKSIKGDCEREVSFLVLSSHLNNHPLTGLSFNYSLIKKEEEECCDEAIAGDCDDCLAPLDVESEMSPNPVDEINSAFKFDYKIESVVKFQMDMSDFNVEYSRGDPGELVMEYYVNSADGSILFPGGPVGFFKTNFSYRSDLKEVDAAIWLANGQMVIYGYGRDRQKRAVTYEIANTANDRFGTDYINMMQFFSSSETLAEHPEPLPEHFKWDNITKGYKGKLIEGRTGIENTWTLYFDTAPTPIKTSCIMMGFMVGVLKDARDLQCNRLLVYNKVNIGGEDTGDAIEAELRSIKPMGIGFDGASYKPMMLGGEYGTDIQIRQRRNQGQMVAYLRQKETLKENRKRCTSEICTDRIDRELELLEEQIEQLNCEIARTMGLDDLMEECR